MRRVRRDYHRCIRSRTYREAVLRLRRWGICSDFGPFYPDDEIENLATKINSRVSMAGDSFSRANRYRGNIL